MSTTATGREQAADARSDEPLPAWNHLRKASPRLNRNPNSYEAQQLNRLSLDQCVKCTICETQRPVARVTEMFAGPEFVGPQAERFRTGESVDRTPDYCSSCGICTLKLPAGRQDRRDQLHGARRHEAGPHAAARPPDHADRPGGSCVLTPVAPLAN